LSAGKAAKDREAIKLSMAQLSQVAGHSEMVYFLQKLLRGQNSLKSSVDFFFGDADVVDQFQNRRCKAID
jgi:hypothetical protein